MDNINSDNIANCKFYNDSIDTLRKMITCLYTIKNCEETGGLGYPILYNEKFDNESINKVIDDCNKHNNCEEAELIKAICNKLMKLSIPQRALLFSSFYQNISNHIYYCNNRCQGCKISKGQILK